MPRHERYIWVCTKRRPDGHPTGSCAASGSEALLATLERELSERPELSTHVCRSSCFDLCGVGPALAVVPEMAFFERITEEGVPALIEALGARGDVATHPKLAPHVARPESFIEPKEPKAKRAAE